MGDIHSLDAAREAQYRKDADTVSQVSSRAMVAHIMGHRGPAPTLSEDECGATKRWAEEYTRRVREKPDQPRGP